MAAYPGILLATPVQAPSAVITPALNTYLQFVWPGKTTVTAAQLAGPITRNGPTWSAPIDRPASVQPHFFEDFYNRIHIRPPRIDLGNLFAETVRTIEVWNAYLVSKTLDSVTPVGDDGMTLAEPTPAPTTFGATESRLYSLTVTRTGQSTIDATYTFDFLTEQRVLTVVGKRVLTWTLPVNWRERVSERFTFLTDVMTARNGTEQRRGLRALPRRSFDFLNTVQGAQRQQIDAGLWGWQARIWVMPIPTDQGGLLSAATVGDVVLAVDTDGQDYAPGGLVVLIGPDGSDEAIEVTAVTSTTVTVAKALLNSWPKGTRVQPARLARLQATQGITHHTGRLAELRVQFDCELHTLATVATDSLVLYRGYPVLTDKPNWREPVTGEYQNDLAITDNQTGVRAVHDRRGNPVQLQDWLWTRFKRTQINALRGWLLARQGRLKLFWTPTDLDDLTVVDVTPANNAWLKIGAINFPDLLQNKQGRRDLCIQLNDGSRYYRRIVSATTVDATTEQLNLDSNLPVEVNPGNTQRVSWLVPSRLEGDQVLVDWISGQCVEAKTRFRSLNDDV